ncbi:MAG TPA: alpha/beta fold hydrolase [Ramlibacter sp.]|nr:alpha/beta fold hydrolase [Ramlibacter sp.]
MNDQNDPFDRALHAGLAQWTRGLSPAALTLAWADWAIHFAAQPARAAQLLASRPWTPAPHGPDRRLEDPAWDSWPFSFYREAWRAGARWLEAVSGGVPGVERHHDEVMRFAARQLMGISSPANLPGTNPQVLHKTLGSAGLNLAQGARNWAEDLQRKQQGLPPVGAEDFVPGRQVACTPGKVVLRNRLMELIQYAPSTPTVHAEPILVMSAWIMKYYILDLSPHNSLVCYLVDQGHTVFAISWRNPDAQDRDLGIGDYLELGLMAALNAVNAIVPGQRVHALGYCLGGTLLAIGAAAMAREHDERLASMTLLAAQTDFSEPGELGLFIDESQLSFLEDLMASQGYLDSSQMAGAFALLRPVDLIWSPMVRKYLLGERPPLTDLLAWNADGTCMPWRMHADYLRNLFLNNDLAQGRFMVHGQPVALGDIEVPIFAVGTTTDHVAPWCSVYKLHRLCDGDIHFVLTDGGHNAGIVSEPGHGGRHFRMRQRLRNAPYLPPERFLAEASVVDGSWWPALQAWLAQHSGARRKPPRMGAPARGLPPLEDAPGQYVMVR